MGEPFIDFTFGSFNSENYGIVRTSDGDRYTISLAPPVQDKTMDIIGMDGSYYFGATYKPKTFDVSFAFQELNNIQLNELKTAFTTTDLQELHFAEDSGSYIAKVTGEPTIKVVPFDNGSGGTIYRGEGSVQFIAYWPFRSDYIAVSDTFSLARNLVEGGEQNSSTIPTSSTTITSIQVQNSGNIPNHFELKSEAPLSQIEVGNIIIKGSGITYWNSKTGIVKNGDNVINYTGDGTYTIPAGATVTFKCTHPTGNNGKKISVYCHGWHY